MRPSLPSSRRQLSWSLSSLVLLGALLAAVVHRYQGPEPLAADAPETEFSAGRAHALLGELLGDGSPHPPHPMGSAANAQVGARVLTELERLGYEPTVQEALVMPFPGRFATVRNVLARLPGRGSGRAVVLACHYDSVAAGPGASDDGAGVAAVLEIARILRAGPPLLHDVIFLIDDGEEMGLLGARAFCEQHPWADDVLAVINLEARGTSGASILFETSDGNAWLAEAFASSVPYPIGSSLAYRVYERMPNDTDLTVFKRHGMHGVNFAYIGEPVNYHTPGDNLENTSRRSLQHHGDNALAMVRALGEVDPDDVGLGNAVYFDLLGFRAVHWPAGWTSGLGVVGLGLVLAAVARLFRRGRIGAGGLVLGLLVPVLGLALAGYLGWHIQRILGAAGGLETPWPATAWPVWTALAAAALCGCTLLAFLVQRWAGTWGLWAGVWTWWALGAAALAFAFPDVAYPVVLPAIAAGLGALLALAGGERLSAHPGFLAALMPALVAAVLLLPLFYGVYLAAGLSGPVELHEHFALQPTASIPAALLAGLLTPFLAPGLGRARLLPLIASFAVAGSATGLASQLDVYTEESPARVSLVYHLDQDAQQARWLVRTRPAPPAALLAAADFGTEPGAQFPGAYGYPRLAAPAPLAGLAGPELEVLADEPDPGGGRRVHLRLRSPRGASNVGLFLLGGQSSRALRLDGREPPADSAGGESSSWVCLTSSSDGREEPGGTGSAVELELWLAGEEPVEAILTDASPGLPPGSEALVEARGATARPYSRGDRTVVSRTLSF